jgi:MobA/VirD2-like, nuclease domain
MIPRVAKLGTGFVGAGMYYMHDKREEEEKKGENKRPSAAEYFLTNKGPAQSADRVGFTATRNLSTDDPMTALRQMAFTAAHAHDIRVAAVAASAKAAGVSYDAYVKATNPFRGRKGTKPVYSMSLSFEPGDKAATKENMLKAADEVRHVLGLQDHQCVIIQHTDTKHPHVHLVINRVNQHTGKYASVSNDRLKLSEWALDWEQRHGKVVCPQRPENWKKRDRNTATKQTARAAGNVKAKAGYVKNKGLPPSEIAFWNEHGSHDLRKVRAARAKKQKAEYESHKRATAMRLKDVDLHHQRANGSTIARIDRTLRVLRGEAPSKGRTKPSSPVAQMFAAVRGAAHGIVARINNRSDIAKLTKIKEQLKRERDIRRAEALRDRRQAYKKMQRIHAWQNWLDEKRCRTYRDSDTRDYRERRDRWDLSKVKPPLFGSQEITFYDVEESKDWRRAVEDRRRLKEPLEMKPIEKARPKQSRSQQPNSPYSPRDERQHAEAVATAARRLAEERKRKPRGRSTGRKRKPRPR